MKEKISDIAADVLAWAIVIVLLIPIAALFLIGIFFSVLVVPLEFCFGLLMGALKVRKSQQELVHHGFFKAATWPIALALFCACGIFNNKDEFETEWIDAKRTIGWG